MFSNWLCTCGELLFSPVKRYLRHHTISAFRALLLGGDALLLVILLYIYTHRQSPHFAAWLAGCTATLGFLFVCAIISTRLHGYQPLRDRWLELATGIMLSLSVVAGVGMFSH